LKGHSDRINSVALSNDLKLGITGSDDMKAIIWDIERGKIIKTLKGH